MRLLYKPEEAAELLAISRSKVFELMACGQLSSVQIGRSRRIPATSAEEYVQRLQHEQGPLPLPVA